ncbi:MAG: hypothetical protein H6601_11730 [Flavobacteriales bacterium]|nr:hypothetical protein [Flavobacteriales bacterium]
MVSTKQHILRVFSLVFLAGYLLNVVSFESFHQAVHHHHHAELHTAAAEADACHRAIYHGEVSHDCEHKGHISKTENDCELCKVTVSRFYFNTIAEKALEKPSHYKFDKPASTKVFGYDFSLAYAPRGPPALS